MVRAWLCAHYSDTRVLSGYTAIGSSISKRGFIPIGVEWPRKFALIAIMALILAALAFETFSGSVMTSAIPSSQARRRSNKSSQPAENGRFNSQVPQVRLELTLDGF